MAEKKQIHINIAKVDGPIFTGEVTSVTVPGTEGEMTLLADHSPLVSALRAGTITVRREDGTSEQYKIQSGTLEVSHNIVTILI